MHSKQRGRHAEEMMGKRGGGALHGAMNIMSLVLLCLTFGRLLVVLYGAGFAARSSPVVEENPVPSWLPAPQLQPRSDHPFSPQHDHQQRPATSKRTVAYDAGRRGEAMPAEEMEQLSNHLRGGNFQYSSRNSVSRSIPKLDNGGTGSSSGSKGMVGSSGDGLSSAVRAWGEGMRVLVFTMDSIRDVVARSKRGGPAGEIIVRESLTNSLFEAGAQVEVAVSDADFERRARTMDIYDAVVVDPWTWAGKGWRLKPQLIGRQHRIFILDFFGSDKPHANLGVPLGHHLTAFPVPASQQRTFLGYHVEPSEVSRQGGEKKMQGVIWGKTTDSFKGGSAHDIVSRLADIVELHSTVAPEDATIRHKNIVYHGHLSTEAWQQLLKESKFMIGLGNPLSGPSAVDAMLAGCTYINPIFATPVKTIYNSQHPFLAQSVGEPYVCSFAQKDPNAAMACARKALEQDLPPLVPQELTKEAHAARVREIFEPFATTALQY
eukprot:g9493.t1